MVKRIFSTILGLTWLLFFIANATAQSPNYFKDRLIIKYESEQTLQQLQTKLNTDPRTAVQQMLVMNGVRQNRPLISDPLRQALQQRNIPSVGEVLRIREITFSREINPIQLAAKISTMPGVAYAEPRYIRKMHLTPNDQLGKFVDAHNFTDAWDITQGSQDIVIAIDDGGVGYDHPDLDDHLWVNQDEVPLTLQPQVDQNNDGQITSTEIQQYLNDNGADYNSDGKINLQDALADNSSFMDDTDSDNNSFTDDLFGWDFWASGGVSSPITRDNNPFHDGTDHGTHVAGIAAAETNNGPDGMAGAGFNTTYMAVKTGGIPDDPSTPDIDESRAIGFGFEGILYAANNGADVINCSWGGAGASQAEQDIINLVTDMGSLVVAASGNEGIGQVGYPAAYDRVLAVGSVEPSGSAAIYSNYGYNLDVLATGSQIRSTSYDGAFVEKTGTSMSTPVVSGLAALVKAEHPGWSADHIGAQVRVSATYIDDSNANRLGHGSVDALRAVDTNLPGLKVVSSDFVNEQGDKLSLGQSGTVNLQLTNVGSSGSGIELQLETLNESGIQLANASQSLGTIATGDTVQTSFDITITNNFDLDRTPTLRLNFSASGNSYSDFDVIEYNNFLYDVIAGNNVKTSFAADGTIGFTDPLSGTGGVGFIPREPQGNGYQEGDNLLFEGGLMLLYNDELFDAVRTQNGVSRDFRPEQVFYTQQENNQTYGYARFLTDADTSKQASIEVETYALDNPSVNNVVFVKYTIHNPNNFFVMEDVYAGLFNDWDLGSNSGNNSISFSESDSLLYVSDESSNSSQPVAAVAHLGPISGALAIDNTIEGQQDSLTFGLYDGFTDTEKSNALTSQTIRTSVQNTDVSAVVASGPYTIPPKAEVTVGFAYAFGNDLDELRNQIENARQRNLFPVSSTGQAESANMPQQTKLFQNYPNPFQNSTRLRIDLQQSTKLTLTVYNALGRKVRILADRTFDSGSHFIQFNAHQLSSGVYFVQMETSSGVQSIPMTLIN